MNTAPIGALWPSWWPTPQPQTAPEPPPVQSFEGDELDATTRPRDRDTHTPHGWRRGRSVTLADVPPLPLPDVNPWARSNPQPEW